MNQQLAAHHQLTLQAFQAAVDSYQQRGIPLPERITPLVSDRPEGIAQSLESHINQLDALSESDPHFEMLYQAFRSVTQNESSERAKFLDTSASAIGNPQNGFDLDIIQSTNGHTKTGPPPTIKRFVLATDASEAEKQYFQQYIDQLKQLNPQWTLSLDACSTGEAEAYVMFPQDENYKLNRAAYAAAQIVTQFFSPSNRR